MSGIEAFENHSDQYEDWFAKNQHAFRAEVEAVRRHIPGPAFGIEIGVGSGLFAEPLGIRVGLEPSGKMRSLAAKRGVNVIEGTAEALPFADQFFDFALMVTTICFLDNVPKSIWEAHRVIRPGGKLIIGLVDKNSPIGKLYQKHQRENVFYRHATFYSTDKIIALLKQTGFHGFYFTQTIFSPLGEINETEKIKEGYGEGSFVVISGIKKNE